MHHVYLIVDKLARRAQELIKGSVASTTAKGYQRQEKMWINYLNSLGVGNDPFLDSRDSMTRKLVFIGFIDHVSGMGRDYHSAMSGLKFYFNTNLKGLSEFDDPAIVAVKTALNKTGRELSLAKERRIRLPTPYAFIPWLRSDLFHGSLVDQMTYLGVAIAYNAGLRACSYAWDSDTQGKHTIRSQDVHFEITNGGRLLPWELSDSIMNTEIVSCNMLNRSDKNDKQGKGRLIIVARTSEEEGQLLDDLVNWSRRAKTKTGDIFFSRVELGRRKMLTRQMVSAALKKAARYFNLPEEMLSSHCNRIGCATDLAAYGYSDEELKKFIGWKSDASFRYQRESSNNPSALRVGGSGGGLTLRDTARLIPLSYQNPVLYINTKTKTVM